VGPVIGVQVHPLLPSVLALADRLMEGEVHEPSPPRDDAPPRLSIGIATHDDFDGAWFTVHSLHLHHPEAMRDAEVVLLDNHPRGPEAVELKRFESLLPNVRYVPVDAYSSTAVRDQLFAHARGELVVVLDSHVLLAPGALEAVTSWFAAHPGSRDLVQGPMLGADTRHNGATHMDPVWRSGMYGVWACDPRADDPTAEAFEIPQHGLAAFACRRDAWPGLSTKFVGFGGEEGYLHEKFRRGGGRVLCLPAFRWQHRFPRPKGIAYRLVWEDRIRNYAIGWSEVGFDVDAMAEHFVQETGIARAPEIVAQVRRGIGTAFWDADGVIDVNHDLRPGLWSLTVDAFREYGIVPLRVSRPEPGGPADDIRAARGLMRQLGWRSAVVLGERAVLTVDEVARADAVLRAGRPTDDERDGIVVRIDEEDAP
jgi:hypothetical protein